MLWSPWPASAARLTRSLRGPSQVVSTFVSLRVLADRKT